MEMTTPPLAESTVEESQATALSHRSVRRFSAVELLVVLVLWLLSAPLVMELNHGEVIEVGLATLVMLSAVVAVGGRRRTLIVAVVLVMPACVCRWINHIRPDLMPLEVHAAAGIVFMLFAVSHLLRFILRAPKVNTEVLCAGMSGYLLTGSLWALAYVLVAQLVPGSFVFSDGPERAMAGIEALYFSFVTLSTIGYGDITPASHASRMLAILEAIAGVFYVTVLIARLVAMHSKEVPPDMSGD